MTSFEIQEVDFDPEAVRQWSAANERHRNWPVVYVLEGEGSAAGSGSGRSPATEVYVGESLNAEARLRQHLENPIKSHLRTVRVVLDDTFNKSVCLDLESFLIRLLAGDGDRVVLNRNDGITDANYFNRSGYRKSFEEIFESLRESGLFSRTRAAIENDDLFKLSPFKALNEDQAAAVENILEGLAQDLRRDVGTSIVVQGDPGTGKTIVAIFLIKLLVDLGTTTADEVIESDNLFSDFFVEGYREAFSSLKVGLVIPQQSLRRSVQRVFAKTPGLKPSMVLSPFDVGMRAEIYDVLLVDETHRLNQRANQSSGVRNKQFREINEALFGTDDLTITQLDWIEKCSRHRIYLVDEHQAVRPADLPLEVLAGLVSDAKTQGNHYPLHSQMRVLGGGDYIEHVRSVLAGDAATAEPALATQFEGYDLRMFEDLAAMREAVAAMDRKHGLARLVAGYAWDWRSRTDRQAYDIELDGIRLRWNQTDVDWINSPGSVDEVGSIHTVQGYDLNYAGVIIGPDLRYDEAEGRLFADRSAYRDRKGKEDNRALGRKYDDEALLSFIRNIYAVLLTRGVRGTFVYVCDPGLRRYLRRTLGVEVERRSS